VLRRANREAGDQQQGPDPRHHLVGTGCWAPSLDAGENMAGSVRRCKPYLEQRVALPRRDTHEQYFAG